MGPQIKGEIGISYADFKKDNQINLLLQPLTDIHLRSDFTGTSQLEAGGDIKTVYIFMAIAIFMLIIACINFINLSTASASKRAKEVGIRKVLGSDKKQLIYQFITESFLAIVIAVVLAIIIFAFVFPVFNELSGKSLTLSHLLRPEVLALIAGFSLFIPFLAGGYPAFFLSSFTPIKALKNKFSGLGGSKGIRGGLVVFQFVISAVLIVATIVVEQQMRFIQNKELGYDKDQILIISNAYLLGDNTQSLKNELLTDPRVESISQSAFTPAGKSNNSMSGIYIGDQYMRRMFGYDIDTNYIPTMGMELISGRNFSEEFGIESDKVIINESAAKALGFNNDALGKTFSRDTNNGKQKLTVIGVIKDFHFKSLKQDIDPLFMLNNPYGGLIVKTKGQNMAGIIEKANAAWLTYNSKEAFEYFILDDAYNNIYITEKNIGNTLSIFALLTIFVACLGLFGLVTYTAEQRIKEIGIRKVLGSSVAQIVALLSKDFLKLVLVSFVIAFPLAYYLMNAWLQDFAYRVTLSPWVFMLAGVTTLVIAFLTVSFKSIQAATVNPVKSLKAE
jgi:putative ABC transport system permease protein